jgi:DNA polymerase elongation subunit (family B)
MVDYFTIERLKNKKLAKETGDSYYDDLQNSQKIAINSAYGFLGAPGLNFNSPQHAAFITKTGREILEKSVLWATGRALSTHLPAEDEVEDEEDVQF